MTALQRLAIVNRGEPAMRLINAVREWNEAGRSPITTIALYTAADRRAMFVREADESVLIGPADGGGDGSAFGPSPYLDHLVLEHALRSCAADAVWPGWGFVSEQADFVDLCDRMGITFVGPSAQVMRLLGDKIEAKRLAERAGVPLAAWSGGPVADREHAHEQAEKIGYPLMVKATAGGGGRGIRLVTAPDGLDDAFERASAEGLSTSGNATVFLERALHGGRHVEVQVVADAAGTVWTLGLRDCSVQRRNQKVIEESSSTALDAELEGRLRTSAAAMVREAGYTNAGTVEFLFDPEERLLSFLEVNTRLQVEHPVTEMTTGTDIVKLQLHIAAGGMLDGIAPSTSGHAIEARLTAEDPQRGFAPAPGRVEHLLLPGGPGIRVDTGIATGDDIPPQFDSMIAKVIAWGSDRAEARARLRRALRQTVAVIDGGTTNKSFLLDVLDRPEFRSGAIDTTWLDRLMADGYAPVQRFDVALVAVAVEAYDAHERRQQARLYSSAERGRPDVDNESWFQVDVRAAGQDYRLRVARSGPSRYRVALGAPTGAAATEALDVGVERTGWFELRLTAGDETFPVLAVAQGPDFLVEVGGVAHRVSGGEAGLVRAPAPAMVVAIMVEPGDAVAAGDVVAVVESMKLETALRAPFAGRVAEVLVDPNTQVEAGRKLVRMEPAATDDGSGSSAGEPVAGGRVDLGALLASTSSPRDAAADVLSELRSLVLGYYVDERGARTLMRSVATVRAALPIDDPGFLSGEIEVLGIVADLCVLSRNRRVSDETVAADDSARNPQEYLNAYLRSRDVDAEELPESFRIKLRRALAHYDVTDHDPDPELGLALYRMYLAHRGAGAQVPVVCDLLQWRLDHPESLPAAGRDAYRQVLDHVVAATQLRHPVIGDLARQVRYRCFDAPLIAEERSRVQRQVGAELDRLSSDPVIRAEQIDAVVAAGEPILGVFAERHHAAMLEVMTRRYYRIRRLEHVQVTERAGRPLLTAQYSHGGHDYTVLATVSRAEVTPADAQDLLRLVASLPPDRIALVDVYVTSDGTVPDPSASDLDARAERIREKLGTTIPSSVGRVAVAVRRPDGEQGGPTWFTFRAGAGGDGAAGQVEDRTLRGMHPMVAERLDLWRLSAFELTRLPTVADVQLFHAQGRDVPDDRRLIALADVRELTTLRDEDGSIRGLPQLEHALDACLDSLRAARSADPAMAKLEWNRVKLYVWPAVDIPLADLDRIVRSLAPRTEALGIEQVLVQVRTVDPDDQGGAPRERMLRMSRPPGAGLTLQVTDPPTEPLRELDPYGQKVIKARRRGATYPYELVPLITRSPDRGGAAGGFTEYDLDADGSPVPVDRAPGGNTANIVLGVVTTPTLRYPEGMTRVVLLGDPTIALGAIAEPECRRVMAAIELARRFDAPVEWFAVSAGAKIAMDSGSETMDWVSRVLRAIIEFTQAGGEMNVVVTGITVGAQPYWNAEATMLMHTRGILVMTPDSTMVLTGKQSLDHSGGVSAEDNFGIGGYDRIMGPNGQAQYWAPDLSGAVDVLLAHYAHSYTAPGERFPRAAATADPVDRDIRSSPHSGAGCDFTRLGEIFDPATNAERKKPFDIRSVLRGVVDADHPTLERWPDMHAAESVVVLDAHLGGQPIALIGIESRPLPRAGVPPVDGPTQWTAGTLFPRSSKKTARAVNAASGNRPLVVLANLSGFDGSPESLRGLQLEYGAEIGRAMVNFDGPIVFCVISRYHGGAFVVFSGTLNDNMEVAAVEGSYASVIGGAPAAAVVFAGMVARRTAADPRIADRVAAIETAAAAAGDDVEIARLHAELDAVRPTVRSQMLGQIAEEFDRTHSIERALQMGSVDVIVSAERLRPYLIDAVQRGIARTIGT